MKRMAALVLLVAATGCIPVMVGAAAGSRGGDAATRKALIQAGQVDERGAVAVGITLSADLHITALRAGSSAEAEGLTIGDRLLRVDGWDVSNLDEAYGWLFGKPCLRVKVMVERKGKRKSFKLRRNADSPECAPKPESSGSSWDSP